MKEIIKQLGVFIKRKLGFCNFKGCWNRDCYELEMPQFKIKRNLCEKHLKKMLEDMRNDLTSETMQL